MLKKIKNGGILALVLAAGMAVLQPASAAAAERHGRDGYQERARVENRVRERGWWDREARGHEYGRYYAPARRYDRGYYDRGYYDRRYYASPRVVYPYGGYEACPR